MKRNMLVDTQSIAFNKSRFQQKYFKNINYGNALHSINEKQFTFTNFVENTGDERFKNLRKIYSSNDPIQILLTEFEEKPVYDYGEEDKKTVTRLFNIFTKSGSGFFFFSNCKDILRYKNKQDKGYQLYFKKDNDTLRLLLVDMYHLGIVAVDKKTYKLDYKEKYNNIYRKYKNCISKIKE
jgi:hypothetical protein